VKKPRTKFYTSPSLSTSPSIYSIPSISKLHPHELSPEEILPIQQRLVELDAKEKYLMEERQILTEQLARLHQNTMDQNNNPRTPEEGRKISHSQYQPIYGKKDQNEHQRSIIINDGSIQKSPEVFSVLTPASQRVLQQVLNQNQLTTLQMKENGNNKGNQTELRDKLALLNEDSPYKPKSCPTTLKRRHSLYYNPNTAPSSVSLLPEKSQNNPKSEAVSGISNNSESTKPEESIRTPSGSPFADPSLQRLSRRVKIVLKPKGQIFPRTKERGSPCGLLNPETPRQAIPHPHPSSLENNKETDLFHDRLDDNWLTWDEI